MAEIIILFFISLFLGMNMGASGFSISFAPSYGSGIVTKQKASLFYIIFLLLGGILIGPRVVETLTTKLISTDSGFKEYSGLIIIISSSLMMFLTNILKIPQSTSWITVGAFSGAGYFYGKINWITVYKIFFIAIIFCILAFFITYFIKKIFYPPRNNNFWLYEKTVKIESNLKKFIVWTDCYSAFAVGSNNIANVVSPIILSISGYMLKRGSLSSVNTIFIGKNLILYIFLVGLSFGLGSIIFGKGVINTISKEIVPIGYISASIISFVTSSFVIIASLLGLPTPYVQFTTFSILAISSVKDGVYLTFKKSVVKKIISVWLIVPVATFFLSYFLHILFLK